MLSGWARTCCPPVAAFRGLGLQVCPTTPGCKHSNSVRVQQPAEAVTGEGEQEPGRGSTAASGERASCAAPGGNSHSLKLHGALPPPAGTSRASDVQSGATQSRRGCSWSHPESRQLWSGQASCSPLCPSQPPPGAASLSHLQVGPATLACWGHRSGPGTCHCPPPAHVSSSSEDQRTSPALFQ